MPTGYTYSIEDGRIATGKDFLMLCARAFGACIEMRDAPLNTEIPEEFKEDDYYIKKLEEASQNLKKYKSMTLVEATIEVETEYNNRQAEAYREIERHKIIRDRYLKILNEIKEWVPPTNQHKGLRDFAIEQIEMSLPEDRFFIELMNTPKVAPKEWIDNNIKTCLHDIEYYVKEMREGKRKNDDRNKWISDLRKSLK